MMEKWRTKAPKRAEAGKAPEFWKTEEAVGAEPKATKELHGELVALRRRLVEKGPTGGIGSPPRAPASS